MILFYRVDGNKLIWVDVFRHGHPPSRRDVLSRAGPARQGPCPPVAHGSPPVGKALCGRADRLDGGDCPAADGAALRAPRAHFGLLAMDNPLAAGHRPGTARPRGVRRCFPGPVGSAGGDQRRRRRRRTEAAAAGKKRGEVIRPAVRSQCGEPRGACGVERACLLPPLDVHDLLRDVRIGAGCEPGGDRVGGRALTRALSSAGL